MPQNIAPPGLISLLAAALAQQPTKPLVLALDGLYLQIIKDLSFCRIKDLVTSCNLKSFHIRQTVKSFFCMIE